MLWDTKLGRWVNGPRRSQRKYCLVLSNTDDASLGQHPTRQKSSKLLCLQKAIDLVAAAVVVVVVVVAVDCTLHHHGKQIKENTHRKDKMQKF